MVTALGDASVTGADALPTGRARRRDVHRRNLVARADLAFGYGFLAPQFLGYIAFALVPIIQVFIYSLHTINALSGSSTYVGAANFSTLWHSAQAHRILENTFVFVGLLTVSGVIFALGLALLVSKRSRGINVFRAIIFIPALVTAAAWNIVWQFILEPHGLADGVLHAVGLGPVPWLTTYSGAMTSVVFVQLIKNVGINMMIFLAALQSIPPELTEAAQVDGARWPTILRRVILPNLSPTILMVTMLMLVGAFNVFQEILLLTNGGPGLDTTVLSFEIYLQAFTANNLGLASAYAVVLFVIVMVLTAGLWQVRKRLVFQEQT